MPQPSPPDCMSESDGMKTGFHYLECIHLLTRAQRVIRRREKVSQAQSLPSLLQFGAANLLLSCSPPTAIATVTLHIQNSQTEQQQEQLRRFP